jgi:hypothetical protein
LWWRWLHVAVLFITGAIGERCQLVVVHHSVPVHGKVNRLPRLGSYEDLVAQCRSAQRCRRRGCPGMARQGHRSRRDVPAPLMTSGAWMRAHAITPVVVGDSVGLPRGPAFPPEAEWGSGEAGFPLGGSGEMEPMPKGSGDSEPAPLGPGDTEPASPGSGESKPFSEGSDEVVVIPLVVWPS